MDKKTCFWPGTNVPRSTGNSFDWQSMQGPSIFAQDRAFIPRSGWALTASTAASAARETAEMRGKEVATVAGIGRIVIDKLNSKSFHVHRPAIKKAKPAAK
ncbi:MAG: hypothetical protein ACK5QX_04770 [bacterium]|jgi:hypothetical protein